MKNQKKYNNLGEKIHCCGREDNVERGDGSKEWHLILCRTKENKNKRHSSLLIPFQRSPSSKETTINYGDSESKPPDKVDPLDFAGLVKIDTLK